MKAIRDHYNYPNSKMKRLANANQSISTLHYTQEHTFSFENYITKLKGVFNILKDNEEPKTERVKVRFILQKIQLNNVQIQWAISTIAMYDSLDSNFDLVCINISESIAIIFHSLLPKDKGIGPQMQLITTVIFIKEAIEVVEGEEEIVVVED